MTVQSGAPGLPGHAMMAAAGQAGGNSTIVIESAPSSGRPYSGGQLELTHTGSSGALTVVTSGSMLPGAPRV